MDAFIVDWDGKARHEGLVGKGREVSLAEAAEAIGVEEDDFDGAEFIMLYGGCLYIEVMDWRNRKRGEYRLVLGRSEFQSDDLATLERILGGWAAEEGYEDLLTN